MAASPNVVLIVTNSLSFMEEARQELARLTAYPIKIKTCSFMDVFRVAEEEPPIIFIVDATESSEAAGSVIHRISSYFTNANIMCVGHPADGAVVIKLIKFGVKDFLSYPLQGQEIELLFERIYSERAASTNLSYEENGRLITFYSPKGGSGTTLIVANLAVALAQIKKQKVVVCDPSSQCGDVATYLNLTPQYTMRDVIDNTSLLDMSFLEGVMTDHTSGIKILAAPKDTQEPLNADHLNALKSVYSLLKQMYGLILIDGSHLESNLLQFTFSQSDLIFLVGNPDVVSFKGLIAYFNKLKSLQYDPNKIKVIINRYNSKNKIDIKEFENMAKHPISINLPNNFALCIEAVNSGHPLNVINPKSDLFKKIEELADIICQADQSGSSNEAPQKNSIFGSMKKGFLK